MGERDSEGIKTMDKELYKAAVAGNVAIFANGPRCTNGYFLQQTSQTKNNIVHIAARHEWSYDFVKEAVGRFPELVCQKNSDNNTPFHMAAQTGNVGILDLLVNCFYEAEAALGPLRPWRVQNSEGNTPLHIALMYRKLQFASVLVQEDPELTTFANKSLETPLHLALRYRVLDNDRQSIIDTAKLLMNMPGTNYFKVHCPPLENSLPVIELLLQKNSSVACLRDANGLTPLLRAAILKIPYTQAIKTIIQYCPESADVCDNSGKTLLHLLKDCQDLSIPFEERQYWPKDLLNIPELHGLKNHQDAEGNTPAHIAAMNCSIGILQILHRMSADFSIENKVGVSVVDLIRPQADNLRELYLKDGYLHCELFGTSLRDERERILKLISTVGEISRDDHHLNSQIQSMQEEGTLLHRLIKAGLWKGKNDYTNYDVKKFIKETLDSCLFLILETSIYGDTPLHELAKTNPSLIDNLVLETFKHYYDIIIGQGFPCAKEIFLPPWRVQNRDGNTPLHEAMLSGKKGDDVITCLIEFLKLDPSLSLCQNKKKETPFHLLSKVSIDLNPLDGNGNKYLKNPDHTVNLLQQTEADFSLAFMLRDECNLTPMLRAVEDDNFGLSKLLFALDPYHSTQGRREADGKTLWHLLAEKVPDRLQYRYVNSVLTMYIVDNDKNTPLHTSEWLSLMYSVDNDKNTPLHIAIEKGNFKFAQFLVGYICPKEAIPNPCLKVPCKQGTIDDGKINVDILNIRNKNGQTPADLIGDADYVPREFEQFFWGEPTLVRKLLGVRSLSGVPTRLIKDYINTIGVVAGLLATVTFTAGFTVPGGSNNSIDKTNHTTGVPLLLDKAAFQVFLISDIIAMWLSMMVLFCLLWIVSMSNKRESVVLLDATIFLLESSFYATLLAFMAGVYVTTIYHAPWHG